MSIKRSSQLKFFTATVFCCFFFLLNHSVSSAATLSLSSNTSTLAPGETATLSVLVNSEGVAINNAEAVITVPADLLEIVSVSKSGSIFSLWVEDPVFSNIAGTITFNGGLPTPGFTGSGGKVISVVVRAKKTGDAEISLTSAAVRANDGLGTDVLGSKQGKTISIIKKEEPTLPTPQAPETPTAPVHSLQISSVTHPNQEEWYKDVNPGFVWTVPAGTDSVRTGISIKASDLPTVAYSPAIGQKTIKNLEDGVWYFKVRGRAGGVWGPVSTYIVRIDTTAPQKKDISFSYDDNTKVLTVTADVQDLTSGIDRYELFINDTLVKTISAKEFVGGNYQLPFNASGTNSVKLVVTDRAGNSIDSSGTFEATSTTVPTVEALPRVTSSNQVLFIRGTTQIPNTPITVNVLRAGDVPVALETVSNNDGVFVVSIFRPVPGQYDVWASSASGEKTVTSSHVFTKVVRGAVLTVGAFSVVLIPVLGMLATVLLALIIGAYYVGRYRGNPHHKLKMRVAFTNIDKSKTLQLLKKRLEKHLELLQETRHERILTKEEKEIKEAIEKDLDEVDRAITEQKSK
jgi:hypothetical protein